MNYREKQSSPWPLVVYNSGPIAKGKISCAAGISISFEREDTLCV